jgi:hypothetical protein
VFGDASAKIDAVSPTAAIRPALIASAAAVGCDSSSVMICPLNRM